MRPVMNPLGFHGPFAFFQHEGRGTTMKAQTIRVARHFRRRLYYRRVSRRGHIDVHEAAAGILGIDFLSVRRAILQRRLPAVRVRGELMLPVKAVRKYAKGCHRSAGSIATSARRRSHGASAAVEV